MVTRIETETYDGITYILTPSDRKKIAPGTVEELKAEAAAKIDAQKEKLGRRYGIVKRDAVGSALRSSEGYRLGLGQGKLDRYNGLGYSEQRGSPEYNLGYNEGWHDNPSGWLWDALKSNPNFRAVAARKEAI
ncbi:MAG: hypothetical protein WC277_09100 [Bacilli bacterium]|jgi:hypothetical protein